MDSFWRGKRVFLTGHTGFKGSWLSRILMGLGAELTGYSLPPPTEPNLFSLSGAKGRIHSVEGDIRDRDKLMEAYRQAKPEIVIHMAAQPIVRDSYVDPVLTYETNVMGTVNLLECVRRDEGAKSVVNVTTDKVYRNNEWSWGYRENEVLDGYDPYSNSKSCSELVTGSYERSFLSAMGIPVSTARAGNVIGGGDFSNHRIIPDCIRSALGNESIRVRNPHSIRPYQHVLEPLFAYLMIAQKQYCDPSCAGAYNVGPDEKDCVATSDLVNLFCKTWGNDITWENLSDDGPHEANFLKLDCSKLKTAFCWSPRWDIETAIEKTVEWTKAYAKGDNISLVMDQQIAEYRK